MLLENLRAFGVRTSPPKPTRVMDNATRADRAFEAAQEDQCSRGMRIASSAGLAPDSAETMAALRQLIAPADPGQVEEHRQRWCLLRVACCEIARRRDLRLSEFSCAVAWNC